MKGKHEYIDVNITSILMDWDHKTNKELNFNKEWKERNMWNMKTHLWTQSIAENMPENEAKSAIKYSTRANNPDRACTSTFWA